MRDERRKGGGGKEGQGVEGGGEQVKEIGGEVGDKLCENCAEKSYKNTKVLENISNGSICL